MNALGLLLIKKNMDATIPNVRGTLNVYFDVLTEISISISGLVLSGAKNVARTRSSFLTISSISASLTTPINFEDMKVTAYP